MVRRNQLIIRKKGELFIINETFKNLAANWK